MNAFSTYHPAIVFGFFVGAVVLSVLVNQPLLQIASLVCAAAYYLCVMGRKAWKVLLGMIPLLIVVAVINPLFNTRGDTVLFTWWGDRPYTLEALGYGCSTSLMLVSILLWFFSYNHVMTSDKFTYLFGKFAPSITLVLTMVLRLVPTYQRKAKEIASARSCIGHSVAQGSLRNRIVAGTTLLSALTTWALEGSIITADSMRSRGYGSGRKTTFAKYKITGRDVVFLFIMLCLLAGGLTASLTGATYMEYYPTFHVPDITGLGVFECVCYVLYFTLPTIITIGERISWSISQSRI